MVRPPSPLRHRRPCRAQPRSGWVSYPIRGDADVPGAIALFRLAYDRATAANAPHRAGEASAAALTQGSRGAKTP